MTKAEAVYEAMCPIACGVCGLAQTFYRLPADAKYSGALQYEGKRYCRSCFCELLGLEDVDTLFQWVNAHDQNNFMVVVHPRHDLKATAATVPFIHDKALNINVDDGDDW